MSALVAFAGDVLVLASRRRTLWLCLIASTLAAGVAVLSLDVHVERRRDLPPPLEPGGARTLRLDAHLVPGSVRLAPPPGARPAWALTDDGRGGLLAGAAPRGRVDYAAPAEVVLDPDVGPVGSDAPPGAGGGPITVRWREALGAARDRAALLAEGTATSLVVGGLPFDEDAARAPAQAAPLLATVLLFYAVVVGVGAWLGVAVGTFLVADAVPSAFEPGVAEVTLSRPVTRTAVVLGRFGGALAFCALQAGWLLGLTTLAVGLKLGLWLPHLLLTLGPLLLKQAVLLAVATLAGTWLRLPALGLVAAGGAWLTSFAVNTLWLDAVTDPAGRLSAFARELTWARALLPQVGHTDLLARELVGIPADVPAFAPWVVVGQDLAWIAACLALTVLVVRRREY